MLSRKNLARDDSLSDHSLPTIASHEREIDLGRFSYRLDTGQEGTARFSHSSRNREVQISKVSRAPHHRTRETHYRTRFGDRKEE